MNLDKATKPHQDDTGHAINHGTDHGTGHSTGHVAGRTGLRRATPLFILAAYGFVCIFTAAGDVWHPEWDSALYLLTGQSIAAGEGYEYLGEPFCLRPPGLSWILSFFAGDDGYDFAALNLLFRLFAAASVFVVYFAVRRPAVRRTGAHHPGGNPRGDWTALAIALLTGTSPLYIATFNFILSELPFAVLLFAAVAFFRAAEERDGRAWWPFALAGAACLAASLYLRTIGIILVPGIILIGALRRRGAGWRKAGRWRALVPAALVILLILPWLRHASEAADEITAPSEQLLLHSYTTAMFHQHPGDPESPPVTLEGWTARVQGNGASLASDLARYAFFTRSTVVQVLMLILLATGFLIAAHRKPDLLEWLVLAYTGVLLTYFTYHSRLVMPLVPLVYVYAFTVLGAAASLAARKLGKTQIPAAAGFAAFVLLLAANVSVMPEMLDARGYVHERGTIGQTWDDYHAAAGWIRENTPEDAVILCSQAPIISLLSGRRAYTYRFRPRPEMIRRYGIDYVMFESGTMPALERGFAQRAAQSWSLPSSFPGNKIGIYKLR